MPPPTLAQRPVIRSDAAGRDGGAPDVGPHLAANLSGYDLGEGDLFKAPEHIIDTEYRIDPLVAAILSGSGTAIAETMDLIDIGSIQTEPLSNEAFCEYNQDLIEKSALEESVTRLVEAKNSQIQIQKVPKELECSILNNLVLPIERSFQKSISSESSNSVELLTGSTMRSNFPEFQRAQLETVYNLRRAYSEGDIQNLEDKGTTHTSGTNVQPSYEQLKIEERRQKLSRYRKKKDKRNFDRKIKYACRKTLADSQPRFRGRFVKKVSED